MRKPNGREAKALLVLSIVAPLSILTTLRLTGILTEPPQLETITVEAVEWKIDRPRFDVNVKESVENSYSNGNVSAVLNIFVDHYMTDFQDYGGSDLINLGINVNANVSDGFIERIRIVFHEEYKPSEVRVPNPDTTPIDYSLKNLSVNDWACSGWFDRLPKLENNTKAFISAVGVNKPSSVSFNVWAHWVLRSENSQNHQMEAKLELVYRAENSYVKVILPIYLRLFA